MAALAGDDGRGGLLAVARGQATDPAVRGTLAAATTAVSDWRKVHAQLRERDDSGQYPDAVKLAIGGESTSAASAFSRLDGRLATAIASTSKTFDERAGAAGSALTATGVGWAILALMIVTGLVLG